MPNENRTVYYVRSDDVFFALHCIENDETLLVPIDEVDPDFYRNFRNGQIGVRIPEGVSRVSERAYSHLFWGGKQVFPYKPAGSE